MARRSHSQVIKSLVMGDLSEGTGGVGGVRGRGCARRSSGVKVTWLFKKWQRELLILCTRTERAAAVTFNGIIDGLSSATAGFRVPV